MNLPLVEILGSQISETIGSLGMLNLVQMENLRIVLMGMDSNIIPFLVTILANPTAETTSYLPIWTSVKIARVSQSYLTVSHQTLKVVGISKSRFRPRPMKRRNLSLLLS